MNRLRFLFAGILCTFGLAWFGLAMIPWFQLGNMEPFVNEEGAILPPPLSGEAEYGRQVYAAAGCMYCHSQEIRAFDILKAHDRDWGKRRTVPRDYTDENPVFLGSMRTGPDLTNVARRLPNAEWHHKHLYAPQLMSPGSIMAPYRYLYKIQLISGAPSPNALLPDKKFKVEIPEGYELVPTYEAQALVAYLLSLNREYPLPEAPLK